MHDLDRTRVALDSGLEARTARELEDDAPGNEQHENDFGRADGPPGDARRLELAMRLLDAAEGALEVARLAAAATRRGVEPPLAVAPATQVTEEAAGNRYAGTVELGSVDLGGLGRGGRWIRRGRRIILLEA